MKYLVSPVTSTAIPVARFEQLFLEGSSQGLATADELAEFVWAILEQQGQRLIREGKTVDSAEDNLKELALLADKFLAKKLPILQKLGVSL